MAIAAYMILSGCATTGQKLHDGLVSKMAEIERIRKECKECEKLTPGECKADDCPCTDWLKGWEGNENN